MGDFIEELLLLITECKDKSFASGNIGDILYLRQLEIDLEEKGISMGL
jgi:hypothetical protein